MLYWSVVVIANLGQNSEEDGNDRLSALRCAYTYEEVHLTYDDTATSADYNEDRWNAQEGRSYETCRIIIIHGIALRSQPS